MGNPGVGNLHAVRRRIEHADPEPLEIEEYSHFGMVSRYMAGAANLPFFPIRSYYESDIPKVNPKIVPMTSPYEDGTEVYVVPPLQPDVAIVLGPARRRRRRHADLGAARLPEGGRVRREARDRRRRGDRRGSDDPSRPEPHRDPRVRSSMPSSRSRSAATRASPRATTTATTASTWSGTRSRRTPRRWRRGSTSGSTAWRTTASTSRSSATRTGTRCGPSPRCPARSTTGGTRERRDATSATRRTRS